MPHAHAQKPLLPLSQIDRERTTSLKRTKEKKHERKTRKREQPRELAQGKKRTQSSNQANLYFCKTPTSKFPLLPQTPFLPPFPYLYNPKIPSFH